MLNLLRPRPGELVLDVGSGTGRYVQHLSKRGVRAVGLEPSASMLAVAKERAQGLTSFVRGVAERLPFSDAVFDAVLFVTTLEFVSNAGEAVSEAARVLKLGGRLVVGVLSSEGPWAASRRKSASPVWEGAHFFTEDEVRTLLEPFGAVTLMRAVYVPPESRLPSLYSRLWSGSVLAQDRPSERSLQLVSTSGGKHDCVSVLAVPVAGVAYRPCP